MPSAQHISDTVFLGLRLYELLTLVGIVIGPIAAVLITTTVERTRRTRDEQIQTLRLLLISRSTPADPRWNNGIALVPVEFRHKPKVLAKWRAYLDVVNTVLVADQHEAQGQRATLAQAALIYEIGKSLGLPLSEGDMQSTAYVSKGFIDRDNLYLDSLRASRDIASAVSRSADISERLLGPKIS